MLRRPRHDCSSLRDGIHDLVGENIFDYLHQGGREEAMKAFFGSLDGTDPAPRTECRFKSGASEWLTIKMECRNMLDGSAIDGMLLYLRDVTDNKKRDRQFESVFNQTFQFTGLLEPDGTVVKINDTALEFGGIGRDDIVVTAIPDVVGRWPELSETP